MTRYIKWYATYIIFYIKIEISPVDLCNSSTTGYCTLKTKRFEDEILSSVTQSSLVSERVFSQVLDEFVRW